MTLYEQTKAAIAALEEAIQKDPKDRGLRMNLAACQKTLKQLENQRPASP